jgi:hypothetical protein
VCYDRLRAGPSRRDSPLAPAKAARTQDHRWASSAATGGCYLLGGMWHAQLSRSAFCQDLSEAAVLRCPWRSPLDTRPRPRFRAALAVEQHGLTGRLTLVVAALQCSRPWVGSSTTFTQGSSSSIPLDSIDGPALLTQRCIFFHGVQTDLPGPTYFESSCTVLAYRYLDSVIKYYLALIGPIFLSQFLRRPREFPMYEGVPWYYEAFL